MCESHIQVNKKILIAVKSCHRDRFMHPWIMGTWGSLSSYYDWVDIKFFVGTPRLEHVATHEVSVPAADDYDSLTSKVDAILNYFVTVPEYTHIFQCDTDTYVDILKLVQAFTGREEYVGFTGMNGVEGAAHGGTGYWLSRASVLEVLRRATRDNIQQTKQDEWWVYERLQEAGIAPTHDDRYSLLTTPSRAHSCITYHDSRIRTDLKLLLHWYRMSAPESIPPQTPHPLPN